MNTDVAGRVRNVPVPLSKPLLPLFEAINNSIQAIEEAGELDGRIDVEIVRDKGTLFGKDSSVADRQLAEVTGFMVTDNGVGFDDRNYKAFQTSDTTYKADRGGRGIGRFTWLVAFEKVEVDSVYHVDEQVVRRRFEFSLQDSGIAKSHSEEARGEQRQTTVRLVEFKDKYRKQCPKKPEVIAAYIVEEFLDIFLVSCPKIVLSDPAPGQSLDLDGFYEKEMVAHSERKQIEIKGQPFDILHLRLYSTHIPEHRVYLCANDRVVAKERLSGVPNLPRRLQGDDGRQFVYGVYVNSSVLDGAVNADRTGFRLSDDSGGLLPEEITLNDIRQAVREHCREYLFAYTEPVRESKQKRIQQYVESDGAMYRPILKHMGHTFDDVDPEATDEEIDRHLYRVYQEVQVSLRSEGTELLKAALLEDSDFDQFRERFEEYFERMSEINRADLARYVFHRKAIIEFLKNQLSRKSDGKYSLEDRIHSIIFPRGKTSDELFFEEHNLWLIDERLAFHVFLSSDKAIGQAQPLQNDSRKEPDILVFDKAIAFAETSEVPFSSITIIEFKKPQRDDYSEDKNPFTQILDYIREIKSGKAKLSDGRSLPVPERVSFYCYVICDVTPKLKLWTSNIDLQKTPDELGYFGYNRSLNAYLEVISYSKLVFDAGKRNQAFFEKLGLPKRMADGR